MFDSGIKVNKCVEDIKNKIDIVTPYGDDVYLSVINETLQLVYSEIIKEECLSEMQLTEPRVILENFCIPDNQGKIRFENITKMYVNGQLLSKSSISNVGIFPDIYYRLSDLSINNALGFSTDEAQRYNIKLFYNAVPVLYTSTPEDTSYYGNHNIPLPYEWISVIVSKVTGEIYKLVNEDDYAAKWLNDYNGLIEDFKSWCDSHYNSYLGW